MVEHHCKREYMSSRRSMKNQDFDLKQNESWRRWNVWMIIFLKTTPDTRTMIMLTSMLPWSSNRFIYANNFSSTHIPHNTTPTHTHACPSTCISLWVSNFNQVSELLARSFWPKRVCKNPAKNAIIKSKVYTKGTQVFKPRSKHVMYPRSVQATAILRSATYFIRLPWRNNLSQLKLIFQTRTYSIDQHSDRMEACLALQFCLYDWDAVLAVSQQQLRYCARASNQTHNTRSSRGKRRHQETRHPSVTYLMCGAIRNGDKWGNTEGISSQK